MTSLAEAAPDSAVAAELTLRASERYTICNRRQIMASLKALQQETGFSEAELEIMASFVLEVNQAYFAGTLSGQQEYLASEGWELWTCYGQEDFWWHYLNGILHETP